MGMCCWFYHKGRKFRANHNTTPSLLKSSCVVDSTTKVGNFEQITTCPLAGGFFCRCWFYHKGRKFRANHNPCLHIRRYVKVVDSTTKVGNFEQITTKVDCILVVNCCWFYHKGRKFRANHNYTMLPMYRDLVVDSTTKVGNFEQITTEIMLCCVSRQLLILPQR